MAHTLLYVSVIQVTDFFDPAIFEAAYTGADQAAIDAKVLEDIAAVETTMRSYFKGVYPAAITDESDIFILRSIALGLIPRLAYKRIDNQHVPESVMQDHEDARKDLDRICSGKIQLDSGRAHSNCAPPSIRVKSNTKRYTTGLY